MGDSLTLYRSLIAFVWQAGVRLHDLRCLYTLVWAVVGLLMTRSINLSLWATVRVGQAQAASKERQLSRWLHNDKIVPQAIHRALATATLSRLCLILAVATFYLVSTGTAIVAMGRRRIVDTHWYRGLSYLQIGWRWVRHALAHGERLPGLDTMERHERVNAT